MANFGPQQELAATIGSDNKLAPLFRLLHVEEESDPQHYGKLKEFLQSVGCVELGDLAVLESEDLLSSKATALVSPVVARKLVYVAEYMRLIVGGEEEINDIGCVDSMATIIRAVQKAAATNSRNGSSAAEQQQRTGTVAPDEQQQQQSGVVRLDVGGYQFTSSRETLCKYPGSALEAMFSGRHQNAAMTISAANKEDQNFYFIDRNGHHFHKILDYLRVGVLLSLPATTEDREALALEADFYGLDAMYKAITMPQVDTEQYLSDEIIQIRRAEQTMRHAFRTETALADGCKNADPYHGLVSVFCPDSAVFPLRYEPCQERRGLACIMDLRESSSTAPTSSTEPPVAVIADSLATFLSNFNREYANVLGRIQDILLEEPVVVAGGAVLRALTMNGETGSTRTGSWWGETSDIDMFLYTRNAAEANRIARRIFSQVSGDFEAWTIFRSHGVININRWHEVGGRAETIQIVLRLYDSVTEVLLGFDCDCCCCAFDGRSVWATNRFLGALRTGVNVLNPLHSWPNRSSYELRLSKYAFRGFAVVVPGLDQNRVDSKRIRSTRLKDLKGLARLLKIAFQMETTPDRESFPRSAREIEGLRDHVKNELSAGRKVSGGGELAYGEVGDVIVPTVFAGGEPSDIEWVYGEDLPLAGEARDEAWEQIEQAPDLPAGSTLSARLLDAWDGTKRSREYLNDATDKYDLDNLYYNEAYGKGENIN